MEWIKTFPLLSDMCWKYCAMAEGIQRMRYNQLMTQLNQHKPSSKYSIHVEKNMPEDSVEVLPDLQRPFLPYWYSTIINLTTTVWNLIHIHHGVVNHFCYFLSSLLGKSLKHKKAFLNNSRYLMNVSDQQRVFLVRGVWMHQKLLKSSWPLQLHLRLVSHAALCILEYINFGSGNVAPVSFSHRQHDHPKSSHTWLTPQ